MRTETIRYEAPQLTILGDIAELTKASFNNSQTDSIFFAGVPVGTATGSIDACVSENPTDPDGTCKF